MKIIVDAFGGDHAPHAVLEGCSLALENSPQLEIALVGERGQLEQAAAQVGADLSRFACIPASGAIAVEDDPRDLLGAKKDCSMAVALQMLANGEGDALLSAGSTAAVVMGASLVVKRIRGVKRAALSPVMPAANGCYMLTDVGANVECRPEMLAQFGIMGSVYMERIMGVESPRVGLVNIGTEPNKGTDLQLEAYRRLLNAPVRFAGNVEARELPYGAVDVAVADGFTGNVILKLQEGMGGFFVDELKAMLTAGAASKLAAALLMKQLKAFRKKLDYTEYGGAPLMGIAKPVIKAHGSSNGKAFCNAIRQAAKFVEQNVIGEITQKLQELEEAK